MKIIEILKQNRNRFIAFLVLFIFIFNACKDPVEQIINEPEKKNPGNINPIGFYVDEDGNFSETDTGRTVVLLNEEVDIVFYSEDIFSNVQHVGFAFEGKNIIFSFKEDQNFPASMVLSDSNESYNGYFTPYDPVTQTYSLIIEVDNEKELYWNISLDEKIFIQYSNNSVLSESQNLRMRNLFIAMCIYTSFDLYFNTSTNLQARSIFFDGTKIILEQFTDKKTANMVNGTLQFFYGFGQISTSFITGDIITLIKGLSNAWEGLCSLIDGALRGPDVVAASNTPIKSTSITLNKTSTSIIVGNGETLIATFTSISNYPETFGQTFINSSPPVYIEGINWSSSNTTIATVTNGTVIANKIGTATITISDYYGKTATCNVTVLPVPVSGVTLNKTTTSMLVGGTEILTATISPSNASNKAVSWSSNNTSVATVSNNGLVTGVNVGTATITVKTSDGSKTASCNVTVNPVPVSSVTLNKATVSMFVGGIETLTATILPSNATNKAVSWSSNNTSVARVSNTGVVTGVNVGTAIITVTTSNGSKTASCTVTVNPILITGISLNKSTTSLLVNGTEILNAVITPTNATNKTVNWNSSNPAVATVSNNGVVTAVSVGTSKISATTSDGGKTASCTVTVSATQVNITNISLNKSSTEIITGESETLTAIITPVNATNQNLVWSSSNSYIASVSNGIVTGVNVGTATINVSTVDGGLAASCEITVCSTSGFQYHLLEGGSSYEIVWCPDIAVTEIIIPSSHNGLPVTHIYSGAFSSCKNLTSVTIPASVTVIGDSAFSGCTNLASVTFATGSKLDIIGKSSFFATNLTSITIPASVTSIGDEAFSSCTNLVSVTFATGSKLDIIGRSSFSYTNFTSIIIPASVTVIDNGAFLFCTNLASVTFATGSKLEIIGQSSFVDTNITSITIPASVEIIGYGAFTQDSITRVTFLGIKSNIDYAFSGDLKEKYSTGGIGTYIRDVSYIWSKQ